MFVLSKNHIKSKSMYRQKFSNILYLKTGLVIKILTLFLKLCQGYGSGKNFFALFLLLKN